MSRLWGYLHSRWINVRRVRFWVLLAVVVYTLAGFFLVPWLAGWMVEDKVRENLDRELLIGDVDFNPFTFTLEVNDFVLADTDSHKLATFDRLRINFGLVSIINRTWTFQVVRLEGPVIQEERFASGKTRFSRLMEDTADTGEDAAMPALVIRDLDITQGVIHFTDHLSPDSGATAPMPTIAVQEFELSLNDAALHDSTRFPIQFAGQLDAGGAFSFDGEMRVLLDFAANGELRLERLALSPARPYVQHLTQVTIDSGSVSLDGQVSVSAEEPLAYRGSVCVEGFSLVPQDAAEPDPLVRWQALQIEELALSAGKRSVEAAKVTIEDPVIREERFASGKTRFSRLMEDTADTGEDAAMPALVIRDLDITQGVIHFTDHLSSDSGATASTTTIAVEGFELSLSDAVLNDSTRFPVRFAGQLNTGGAFSFDGEMRASPDLEANGDLNLEELALSSAQPYVQHLTRVAIDSGSLSLNGQVSASAEEPLAYRGSVGVEGLRLVPRDVAEPDPLVSWRALRIEELALSAGKRSVEAAKVTIEDPVIREERFASGKTRFSRLMEDTADTGEDAAMPALVIRDLDITQGVIHFTDHLSSDSGATASTTTIAVEGFELSLSDAVLNDSTRFPVRFAGQLNTGGAFSFDGEMRASPDFAANGELRLERLALRPARPYVQHLTRVAIDSGSVSLDGQVSVSAEDPLAYRGSVGVAGFRLVPQDAAEPDPLVRWRALQIEELALSAGERSVEASTVTIEGGYARVIIHKDQSTNFDNLLVSDITAKDSAPEGNDSEDVAPIHVSIAGIVLSDSRLQFADRSLPLPFSTRIHDLDGEISTLASDTQAPADIQLEGRVAQHGLARIEGTIFAWHPMRDTNIKMTFRNLITSDYSPYTVDFAGRKIAEGRLDLDLDYRFTDGKLEGDNKIVLYDLKLGEKVENPDAMDLPLDLAVALLKNREGVIEMNIPVTGNLGDPQFDLGEVIRKAVRQAIGKIVGSPFRFLAQMLGAGAEDLQRIAFPPGRSDLTPPQRQNVGLLRKALAKRPELILELAGPFDRHVDGSSLKRQRAVNQLARQLRRQGREVASPDLTAKSTQDAMETIFSSAYPDSSLGDIRDRFKRDLTDEQRGGSKFDAVAYRAYIAEQVIAAQPLTDSDLAALGSARAAAVRDQLLADAPEGQEEGIAVEPDRVLLMGPRAVESENKNQVEMEVGLAVD